MNGYDRRQLRACEGYLVFALMQIRLALNEEPEAPMSNRERALRCAYARRRLLHVDKLLERTDARLLKRPPS